MYNYLEGSITELKPAFAVIDVQGVGYGVNISLNTFSKLENKKKVRLYTHVAFKIENTNPTGIDIYGFFDEKERTLFRHLISVSRIGYNISLVMLSAMKPEEIYQSIVNEDIARLKSIKGIGEKAAQRLIIELKDKVGREVESIDKLPVSHNFNTEEALSALVMLGFNKQMANKAIGKVIKQHQSDSLKVEDLIKEALKII